MGAWGAAFCGATGLLTRTLRAESCIPTNRSTDMSSRELDSPYMPSDFIISLNK